jgi:hypothetical protein
MPLSALPALLASCFTRLARCLQKRSAEHLPALLVGILLARGRRTVTSWFRAAGITAEFRKAYTTVWAVGRNTDLMGAALLGAIEPCLDKACLRLAIDDTPTRRWGPQIEGADIHHNPTPGPAAEKYFYGHVWVALTALACHPRYGVIALPLLAALYLRQKTIAAMPRDRRVPFRTKLQLGGELLAWLHSWRAGRYRRVEVVVDGGYAKRPFLREARRLGMVVFGRLRRDAALFDLPVMPPPGRPGRKRGWQQVGCVQYGETVSKTIKTFLATWKPAGGTIRVVLLKEESEWLAYFCTDPAVTAEQILEAMAQRTAIEQTFKDVKEVYGAQEQQVRNLSANVGCFNLNGWMYSVVEAWAWDKSQEELVNRSACPWDNQPRRPSAADKRKALQRQVLRQRIRELLLQPADPEEMEERIDSLLQLAL